jgi:hypothetical protein
LVAILAVAGVINAFTGNAQKVIENIEVYNEATQPEMSVNEGDVSLSAFASPDIYQRVKLNNTYINGGERYATSSTASTYTLTSAEMKGDIKYIDWTPNVNTTLTTMATSTMGFMDIGDVGNERVYYLRNASSTAAASITLAAGTGVDLQVNEDSADLAILGLDMAKLTFMRKNNTDVILIVEEYTEGD